jgi:hypothetical protein
VAIAQALLHFDDVRSRQRTASCLACYGERSVRFGCAHPSGKAIIEIFNHDLKAGRLFHHRPLIPPLRHGSSVSNSTDQGHCMKFRSG